MIIGIIINSWNVKNDWEKKATCSAYLSPRFLCRPTTLYIIARAVERLQQLYKSRYTTEESRTRGRFDWKSLQGPKRLTDPDLEYFPHSKFRPAHSKCGERHSYDQIETETYWLLITKCKLMQNYLFCKHILHTSTDNSLNVTKNWIYKNIWILTFLLPKSLTLVILTILRISTHTLLFEKGRYRRRKLPRDLRQCTVCTQIEDEEHFILFCKKHDSISWN